MEDPVEVCVEVEGSAVEELVVEGLEVEEGLGLEGLEEEASELGSRILEEGIVGGGEEALVGTEEDWEEGGEDDVVVVEDLSCENVSYTCAKN